MNINNLPIQKFQFYFILILFCISFLAGTVHPQYKNVPVKVKQPDGKELKVFVSGDYRNNWIHDSLGYTIIQDNSSGEYRYGILKGEEITASTFKVGDVNPKTTNLIQEIIPKTDKLSITNPLQKMGRNDKTAFTPNSGEINNIVVFIRFNDETEFTSQTSHYEQLFNDVSDSAISMKNYFSKSSYNQLNINSYFYPVSGSIISYQDIYPRAYYQPYNQSTNSQGYKNENDIVTREHSLLKRAVEFIAGQIPGSINLDMNNDGYVDNICFIIKGYATGWSQLLWPHKWELYSQQVFIGDKRVLTYNVQLEEFINSQGIAVLCHEMFHSMGAPDLYHYNHDSFEPVAEWDIMSIPTNPPQHMGAFMKYKYGGWISDIPEITSEGVYTLNPITSNTNNAYKIKSPFSEDEYFIIEYRKKDNLFESEIPSDGLLVYRVNSLEYGNTTGNDEIYIYRPNGSLTTNGSIQLAAFTENYSRTNINDNTNPSSFLSNGNISGLNISEIGKIGDTISFKIRFPENDKLIRVLSPNNFEALIANSSYNIEWSSHNVDSINILFTLDYGNQWDTIVSNFPAVSGKFLWSVPEISSNGAKIKILSNDMSISDTSDYDFVILENDNPVEILWEDISDELTDGSIESMGVAPNGDIYATIWKLGGDQIYTCRSTNNGISWEKFKINNWDFGPRVQDWLFLDNGKILMACYNSIYHSSDNGSTWGESVPAEDVPMPDGWIYDISQDYNNNILVAAGLSIYRSTDDGINWVKLTDIETPLNPNGQISHIETNGQNIFASTWGGGIHRSTDNGSAWEEINNGMEIYTYETKVLSTGRILAGTLSGLFISDDLGNNWTKYDDTELNNSKIASFIETDDGIVVAGSYGCNGPGEGCFASSNFGNSWNKINEGLTETSPKILVLSPNGILFTGIGYGDSRLKAGIFKADLNPIKYDWKATISLSDEMGNLIKQPLVFGQAETATDGIDSELKETNINVPMEVCQLEARFNHQAQSFQLYEDYRNNYQRYTQWEIKFEPSAIGYPLTINWNINKSLPGILHLIDPLNDSLINMQEINSYVLNSSENNMLLIEYYDLTVPVELTSFTGLVKSNHVVINWSTSTETNNKGFEIERKLIDNPDNMWEKVGYIDGKGTTTETFSYSFSDNIKKLNYTGIAKYRLKQIDLNGVFTYSDEIELQLDLIPQDFVLYQNYPNPFNPSTKIKFDLPEKSEVSLEVFDILGRKITQLINGEFTAGTHEINFNGGDLATGVYIYRLKAGNFISIKKLQLIK